LSLLWAQAEARLDQQVGAVAKDLVELEQRWYKNDAPRCIPSHLGRSRHAERDERGVREATTKAGG